MKPSIRKIIRLTWIIAGISFITWMVVSMNAKGIDPAVFESNNAVRVSSTNDLLSFTPAGAYKKVVLFFPGALVDPDAYAPLCRNLAEAGCQAIIVKMPWRLATYGYKKIMDLGILVDKTREYVLAGHSQGGKMAAQFVYENPGFIDQLILLGTTHPRDIDLSALPIPVMKIYGSSDGVADAAKIEKNKHLLPLSTKYVLIEGGNHSQFGYYGFQLSDHKAGITRLTQQKLVVKNMLEFINSIK